MIPRPLTRTALYPPKSQKQPTVHQLFDKIPHRTTLLECNRLLFEYSHNNQNHEAIIETYRSSKPVNDSTLSCILKISASRNDQIIGKQVHLLTIKLGYEDSVNVGTSLVDMYMKCGSIQDGRTVFDLMPERNAPTWSALLTGHTQNGLAEFVLDLFFHMQSNGVKPNPYPYTLTSGLSSCAAQRDAETGKRVYSQLVKLGFESTTFVCNSLINMYSKCGLIREAKLVFEFMEHCRNVVSWNSMIAGLVQNEYDHEALRLFDWMQTDTAELCHRHQALR